MTANEMGDKVILKLQSSGFNLINFDDRERSELLTEGMYELINERFIPDMNVKRKGFEMDIKRRLDLSGLITSHTEFKREQGDFMQGTADNGALKTPDKDYQSSSLGDEVETDYGVFFSIPNEALYIISESADTKQGNSLRKGVPVEAISYEEYAANIHNNYKNPYYNKVWRLDWGSYTTAGTNDSDVSVKFNGNQLTGFSGFDTYNGSAKTIDTERSGMLIPGKDWIIEKYRMHYVKRPRAIVVDTISPLNQVRCELHEHLHKEVVDKAVQLAIESRIPDQAKYQVAEKNNIENQ